MIFSALISLAAVVQAVQVPTTYLPNPPVPNTVLAKVNGKPIRTSDVDRLLWDWAGPEVTNDLILFQLIRDRAALDKVTVSPADVQVQFDKQLAEIKRQLQPGQDLDAFLREKGFPKSRLYLHVQADLLITKIVDLKFKQTDYISISTLVVKPKAADAPGKSPTEAKPPITASPDSGIQEATGRAMDVYNRLKKGEDWDKVLASTDQSPQTIQTHGILGWRAIDAFPPATKAEFRTLKLHEYTKPVQTANGLQIFRIDAFGVTADAAALADLKKQFEDRAKNSLIPELQKSAKIEKFFPKSTEKPHKATGKLGIEDKKIGTGLPVATGDEVSVIYTGRLTTGQVFDTNNKPGGMPFKFVVGAGTVIKGWDLGLIGMKKGGQRKLTIPYSLAYGEQQMPGIPSESDLVFDVEVVDIQKPKGH